MLYQSFIIFLLHDSFMFLYKVTHPITSTLLLQLLVFCSNSNAPREEYFNRTASIKMLNVTAIWCR